MASAHAFFQYVPNWAGFAVLIGIWILFRSFLLKSRRSTLERMRMGRAMPPVPPPAHGDLPEEIAEGSLAGIPNKDLPTGMTMEELEKLAIQKALEQSGGKQTRAAESLGISVRTLQRKLRQYQMEGEEAHLQIRCPRCSAMAPGVAMYCPHCGLSFESLPPPIPMRAASRPAPGRLLMLIWILLGVIGLAAFVFWRFSGDELSPPAMPERPHVHMHDYYR